MIALEETSRGVVLPVKALPGSRSNRFQGTHAGAIKVAVTQVAEKGKANDAIARFLAEQLTLRPNQIELISGTTASLKKFLITGISCEELQLQLQSLIDR